jgi:hypothetical protein
MKPETEAIGTMKNQTHVNGRGFPFYINRLCVFLRVQYFSLFGKIAIAALLVLFPYDSFGTTTIPPEQLSAQEIIRRAINRAEAQHESQVEALFESEALSITQSLDSDNKPTKTESARYRQYPIHGALFEELIEQNGILLGEKDLRKEANRKQDFTREVDKRRSQGKHPQPEPDQGVRMNQEFAARYQLKLTGTEMVRDNLCWVISFEPKPGDLPVRNRMDRALNQSTGRFWVAQEDDGIVRVEFALRKPFKYWGGILAVIRNTDGKIDYIRIEPNVWVPLHFDLKLDLEVMLVKDIRRVITKSWTRYQRAKTR